MSLKKLCCFFLVVVFYTIIMILYFHGKIHNPVASFKFFPRKLIVLVSQPRSGSTYLGNVISKSIKSIYFYEPLYMLDSKVKIDLDVAEQKQRQSYDAISVEYLRHVFHCDFNDRESWQSIFNSPFKSLSTMSGNECDDDRLKYKPEKKQAGNGRSYTLNRCMPFLNANHLQKRCQTMDLMVKLLELRLPFSDVFNLKEIIHNKMQYKIIYLVRDPRAAFYSLLKTGWVVKTFNNTKFTKYVSMRCKEMFQNVKQIKNANNIIITRYEDVMVKPASALKGLYTFISTNNAKEILQQLKMTMCYVPKFINTFNNSNNKSAYKKRSLKGVINKELMKEIIANYDDDKFEDDGEIHNAVDGVDDDDNDDTTNNIETQNNEFDKIEQKHRENYECYSINKWRYDTDYEYVKLVENSCSGVMEMLGYKETQGNMEIVQDITYSLVEPEFKIKPYVI